MEEGAPVLEPAQLIEGVAAEVAVVEGTVAVPVVPTYSFRARDSLHFAPARIKKIMLSDNDVGKIKKETPSLVALCVELFIEQLIMSSADAAAKNNAKLLSSGHLRQAIMANVRFDFLQELVSAIPDLPEPAEEEVAPGAPKRSRKKKTDEEGTEKVTIKKSGGKKAGTPRKPRKKKAAHDDDDEDYMEGVDGGDNMETEATAPSAATTEMPVELSAEALAAQAAEQPVAPVVVSLSLGPTTVTLPKVTQYDEDDFDA